MKAFVASRIPEEGFDVVLAEDKVARTRLGGLTCYRASCQRTGYGHRERRVALEAAAMQDLSAAERERLFQERTGTSGRGYRRRLQESRT